MVGFHLIFGTISTTTTTTIQICVLHYFLFFVPKENLRILEIWVSASGLILTFYFSWECQVSENPFQDRVSSPVSISYLSSSLLSLNAICFSCLYGWGPYHFLSSPPSKPFAIFGFLSFYLSQCHRFFHSFVACHTRNAKPRLA